MEHPTTSMIYTWGIEGEVGMEGVVNRLESFKGEV